MQESDHFQRAEFGVLFVGGIGKQHPGSTVGLFASALYRWSFRSNRAAYLSADGAPSLHDTRLSADSGDGGPARATLSVPVQLERGRRDATWLLAESSWADVPDLPRFMALARWIWKVSTCLLVMQFVIPLRRHWHSAHRSLASRAVVLGYLVLIVIAAMLSVLLSLVLMALAIVARLPIPRIDQAVHWVILKLSATLGDSYLLAHCPVQFAAMRTRVARDLAWLQSQCQTVAIVAHSQGAAIAHQVLKGTDCPVGNVKAFITLGQGIAKLHLLQELCSTWTWWPRASPASPSG
jgi:hypothetical protein